jgi:hypothetical protein
MGDAVFNDNEKPTEPASRRAKSAKVLFDDEE